VVPAIMPFGKTEEDWLSGAEVLSAVGRELAPHGMRIGYHNHFHEFERFDGRFGWDILLQAASDDVIVQLDVGHALHGGADPVACLRRYPGRATTVHIRDYSPTDKTVLVGEGDVPWEDVFEVCETVGGTEWYIVEQKAYGRPSLQCAERCRENLRKMGK